MLSMPFVVALLTRKLSMDGPAAKPVPTVDDWYAPSTKHAAAPLGYSHHASTRCLLDSKSPEDDETKLASRDRSDTASTVSTSASHDYWFKHAPRPSFSRPPMRIPETPTLSEASRVWRNVFERLYQADYHQKRDARLAEIRARLYSVQCTYAPATTSTSSGKESAATLTIVARLYNPTYHQDRLARLEAQRAALDREAATPALYSNHDSNETRKAEKDHDGGLRTEETVVARLYSSTYLQDRDAKLTQLQVQYDVVECSFAPAINSHKPPSVRKPLYDPNYHQTRSAVLMVMQDNLDRHHASTKFCPPTSGSRRSWSRRGSVVSSTGSTMATNSSMALRRASSSLSSYGRRDSTTSSVSSVVA